MVTLKIVGLSWAMPATTIEMLLYWNYTGGAVKTELVQSAASSYMVDSTAGEKCKNFLQQSHSSPEIQDELYLVVLLLVKESSLEEKLLVDLFGSL